MYDDVYTINGIAREFIQKSMVGGWTICSQNEKKVANRDLDDLGAVSLYPSAMERLCE